MMMPSVLGENLFEDFWNDNFAFPSFPAFPDVEKVLYGKHAKNLMKTDVKETDAGYEIDMDLPGFEKDEVKVALEDGYLTVSASKGLDREEREEKTDRYIRRERYTGSCQRSFYVGSNITEEDVKGEFKHGILKLTIPRREAEPAVAEKKYIALEG